MHFWGYKTICWIQWTVLAGLKKVKSKIYLFIFKLNTQKATGRLLKRISLGADSENQLISLPRKGFSLPTRCFLALASRVLEMSPVSLLLVHGEHCCSLWTPYSSANCAVYPVRQTKKMRTDDQEGNLGPCPTQHLGWYTISLGLLSSVLHFGPAGANLFCTWYTPCPGWHQHNGQRGEQTTCNTL